MAEWNRVTRFGQSIYRNLARGKQAKPRQLMDRVQSEVEDVARDVYRTVNNLAGAKLFVPPGHFYSPVVDPAEAGEYLATLAAAPVAVALPGIRLDRTAIVGMWNALLPYLSTFPFPCVNQPEFRYASENPAYGVGDAMMLHAMLRHFRPRRLIEVGSGWSSACTVDTVERYLGGQCDLTFIEPYPKLLHELIGETATRIGILEQPVQRTSLDTFEALGAGDILFIDSTHVLRTGSDVCFELFEVLPRLARGVVVHFHDMFWPFEYPREWVVDENRSWNELYAMRAFLTANEQWNIIMFNNYLARLERPLIEASCPAFLGNAGGALWLQRA